LEQREDSCLRRLDAKRREADNVICDSALCERMTRWSGSEIVTHHRHANRQVT